MATALYRYLPYPGLATFINGKILNPFMLLFMQKYMTNFINTFVTYIKNKNTQKNPTSQYDKKF